MVSQKNYFMNYKKERGKSKFTKLLYSYYTTKARQKIVLFVFDACKKTAPCLLFEYVTVKSGNGTVIIMIKMQLFINNPL